MIIYTIEATSCKLDLSIVTWYFSSGEMVTESGDTPANTCFVPRVINPGSIGINLFSNGKTSGGTKLEIGEVVLENSDGSLDDLARYSFDGRKFVIRRGDNKAAYPSGFTTIFIGTAESVDVNWETVTFRLRDKSYIFERPLLTAVYYGTNVLPAGIDGTPDDIKGDVIPRMFGYIFNSPPVLVNTSKLIYQISVSNLNTVVSVRDQGVALAAGVDYANNAALQAATGLAASTYYTCKAEGLIRLGSTPNGQITMDVYRGTSAANRTTAQLLSQIASLMGITAYASDVTALDALNSSILGYFVNDNRTAAECLDAISESIGAYWYFDRLEQFRMGQLTRPSGSPVKYLYPSDVIDIKSIPANDKNVAVWKVTLNYKFNETVQNDSDLAGSVSQADRAYYKKQSRKVVNEQVGNLIYSKLAKEITINSRLIDATAAQTECDRMAALYAVLPINRVFEVTIPIETFNYNLLDYIYVQCSGDRLSFYNQFNGASRLIGYNLDLQNETATLTLW